MLVESSIQFARRLAAGLRILVAGVSIICFGVTTQGADRRPNILWITTEDLSPVLGCYGDAYAVTPNLDRLAQQGVRYTNAFASASVCTPARSSLITGVFASSLGTQHLRGPQPLSEQVRCFPQLLREAGYYCTNNVKEDYNFPTPAAAWDESSRTAHWRNGESGKPFFSVFNLLTTHQSRIRFTGEQLEKITARLTPQQRHVPALAPLPPYYPDTPLVRHDVAQLYDLATAMDRQVQDLLDQLQEDGLADDTIVFFYSDHGTGMPRHKRWLHDSGIHVPLIIRFPEKYRQLAPVAVGETTDRMVSFVDFAPTVLSLVDLPIPETMQGRAFLGRQAAEPRQYVFAIRDRVDEVYEMSRTVRDKRYQYIRNFMPHRPRLQYSDYSEKTPTRVELRRLAASGELSGAALDLMSPTKPAEELYDTDSDPHQIRNLATDPGYEAQLTRLRAALRGWMIETRDTGLLPEAEMHARSAGGAPYDMARDNDRFNVTDVLAAADLVGRGPDCLQQATTSLADPDSAVRFWATTALMAMGEDAAPALPALRRLLDDKSASVRLAAAEAVCRLGASESALPVVAAALNSDSPAVRLQAAIVLAAIGGQARPVLPSVQTALSKEPRKGDYSMYIRWALERVVRQTQ